MKPADHEDSTTALLVAMTRIETKLDTMTTGHGDHETRLRTLEKKVWYAAGGAAVVAAGAASWITNILGAVGDG